MVHDWDLYIPSGGEVDFMATKAESTASVIWTGNLFKGAGRVSAGSGVFKDVGVSWAARTGPKSGNTSPEELIAAAHASCYAMAFSNMLDKRGTPPERLNVNATCIFEQTDAGFKVSTMNLEVRGKVPGIDAATFAQVANEAKDGCPVSKALQGNVTITVKPTLEK
jgi:osmotically inducible protein OsmC